MADELVPESAARALAELDAAKTAIAHARELQDVEALTDWRDRAMAVQSYASRRDDAKHIADDAGEIKLYAERALGQIDTEVRPASPGRRHAGANGSPRPDLLAQVTHDTRWNWRKLGALPEGDFEAIVADVRATEPRVTTAAVVRRVHEPKPTSTPTPIMRTVKAQRQLAQGIVSRVINMEHLEREIDVSVMRDAPTDGEEREEWLRELRTARRVLARVIQALSSDA
jgi:hypothetical protein